ncbi:MAG: GlsB/YeaQ/YmgE family stress response membrane protein [Actinomycetota bacterium]
MLILFIIVWGMAVGWIAHWIVNRNEPVNWAEALIAGVVGSFVGGLIASLIAGDGVDLRPSGIIGSIIGAVIVLLVVQVIRGGSRRRT